MRKRNWLHRKNEKGYEQQFLKETMQKVNNPIKKYSSSLVVEL